MGWGGVPQRRRRRWRPAAAARLKVRAHAPQRCLRRRTNALASSSAKNCTTVILTVTQYIQSLRLAQVRKTQSHCPASCGRKRFRLRQKRCPSTRKAPCSETSDSRQLPIFAGSDVMGDAAHSSCVRSNICFFKVQITPIKAGSISCHGARRNQTETSRG